MACSLPLATRAVRCPSASHPTLPATSGFTLHYVGDLPMSTRSVTDLANGRIYLPVTEAAGADQRSTLLQALATQVLEDL